MASKKQTYQLAQSLGMSITENREGKGITVKVEAPFGKNFNGSHEITLHYYSGSPWTELYREIQDAKTVDCEESTCGSWADGRCEWWDSEEEGYDECGFGKYNPEHE